MTVLMVIIGAAVGAPARYLTDRFIATRHESVFPWGTLTVNVLGSLLLGFLAAGSLTEDTFALLGIGLCGAFTTYSTFGYETLRLIEDGATRHAVANIALNVVVGLAAAALGYLLWR